MGQLLFKETLPGLEVEQVIREQEFSMNTRHLHESYEVYFLLEGSRYYFIESDTYLVKEGMTVLVGKNQIHKTSMAGENSYHNRILLQLDAPVWDMALKKCGLPPLEELFIRCEHVVECRREDFVKIAGLLDEIKWEMREKRACFEAVVRMKIVEVLVLIYRNRREEKFPFLKEERREKIQKGSAELSVMPPESSIRQYHAKTERHKKVHEVAEYLQKHCETKESVEEISRRFFVSKSYLSRIFREVTGFGVNEYQTLARVRRAQELLTQTDLSITEVAEEVGFENITYFERVFKKYTEKRPLQYRKEYGKLRKNREKEGKQNG